MNARIKSGHDECVCVHANVNFKQWHSSAHLASTSRTEFDGYRWRFTHPTRLARPLQKKPLRWNDDHHLTSLKPMQSLRTIA
jgi:hypothetical protein